MARPGIFIGTLYYCCYACVCGGSFKRDPHNMILPCLLSAEMGGREGKEREGRGKCFFFPLFGRFPSLSTILVSARSRK